jgi:hypothetical protein
VVVGQAIARLSRSKLRAEFEALLGRWALTTEENTVYLRSVKRDVVGSPLKSPLSLSILQRVRD